MKINVCVNGTFRYPQYIRHFDRAGVLGAYVLAHRRSTNDRSLGLESAKSRNVWWKEYALQAAARWAPEAVAAAVAQPLCDAWQRDVIRHWQECDSLETVIGAVADRVIAHARTRGSRVVGHPVTSHPDTFGAWVGRAYADLGLDPKGGTLREGERRRAEIAGCDRLLVDSAFVARSFRDAGVPPERIVTVTPGVDLARFHARPAATRASCFRVVCVGTVTPRKAQHVLLRAWTRLALPAAELVLVGPRGRAAAAVVSGFDGRFVHQAHVDNRALRDLLVTAAAFVMPSVEDGFAQAPLEAMACGVPVIVTRNVGMADCVTDGVDGFVVPPLDVEALQARIETLYRDPDRATAMGEAAAATAQRLGSWQAYVDRVIDIHRTTRAEPPVAVRTAA